MWPLDSVKWTLEKYQRGERVLTMEIDDDGKQIRLGDMVRDGNVIIDKIKNKEYSIVSESIDAIIPKKIVRGIKRIYLLDAQSGTTVSLDRDDDIVKIRTNARLNSTVIQSRLLQQFFSFKPDSLQTIIMAVLMLIIGFLAGKAF